MTYCKMQEESKLYEGVYKNGKRSITLDKIMTETKYYNHGVQEKIR